MNKNFAMREFQTVSHKWAEACPPPCVNTTNKLQPFGHRRGKKTATHRPVRVEHDFRAVTLVRTMRKPFDVLAEGLIVKKIGARGFEPPTSWSRTRRSSQTEPRPVLSLRSSFSQVAAGI